MEIYSLYAMFSYSQGHLNNLHKNPILKIPVSINNLERMLSWEKWAFLSAT